MVAIISVFLFFGGCATTHSITFASAEQPHRDMPIMEYKHVAIRVRSGNSSVLERFYAMYPSHKYQVVAYERVSKKYWMPLLGSGGGLLFGLIGSAGGGEGFAIGFPMGVLIGSIVGWFMDGTYYVVTYVER